MNRARRTTVGRAGVLGVGPAEDHQALDLGRRARRTTRPRATTVRSGCS